MNLRYNTDTLLYVGIAVLTAEQALHAPLTVQKVLGLVLVGLVTWKAKRSPGKEQT